MTPKQLLCLSNEVETNSKLMKFCPEFLLPTTPLNASRAAFEDINRLFRDHPATSLCALVLRVEYTNAPMNRAVMIRITVGAGAESM